MLGAGAQQTFGRGRKTATAGTAIVILIRPRTSKKTKLTKVAVTNSTTAHTLTAMTPQNTTTVAADAAGGQAVVKLKVDPGVFSLNRTPNVVGQVADNPITTGDYLVFQTPDGAGFFALTHASTAPVVNPDGTVTVTLAANLPTGGVKANTTVWFMGLPGDTDPATGEPFPVFTIIVSAVTILEALTGSLVETWQQNAPILLVENNLTAAATVEYAQGVYGP